MSRKKNTPPKRKKMTKKASPKQRMNYSREQMDKAIEDVKSGMSCSEASKKYGVPRVTLLYKVQGKFKDKKCGRESYLTSEEERLLVDWIIQTGKAGFPITKTKLLDSVQRLVKNMKKKNPEREFPFIGDRPGRHWYESFLRRHPEISLRTPQNLTSSRANVTEQNLPMWHSEVTKYLQDNGLFHVLSDPKRVFNADEAAFFLNPKGNKVLFSRGEKCVYTIVNNNEKECLTVMVSGNANGDVCPSMIVYQYERVPQDIVAKLPTDWGVGRSESGWMTTAVFYEFLTNIFHPWLTRQKIELPVIYFVDGHTSHQSLHTSQFCNQNGIILVALYPNATHVIQPMDVAVFRTLKSTWKEEVHRWRQEEENIGKELKKRDFGPLLEKAITKSVTPTIMQNGFQKCGLFPWEVEAINFKQNPRLKNSPAKKEVTQKTTPKDEDKLQIALAVIEEEIGLEKLNVFYDHVLNLNSKQDINIEDYSLFQVWKTLKSRSSDNSDQSMELDMLLPVITESDLSGINLDQLKILASEENPEVISVKNNSNQTTPEVLDEQDETLKGLDQDQNVPSSLPSSSKVKSSALKKTDQKALFLHHSKRLLFIQKIKHR